MSGKVSDLVAQLENYLRDERYRRQREEALKTSFQKKFRARWKINVSRG